MPSRNKQGRTRSGQKTRVAKVSKEAAGRQLSRLPVAGQNSPEVLHQPSASVAASPEVGNCPVAKAAGDRPGDGPLFVPVQDKDGRPLMPMHPARARELVKAGKAKRRFSKGVCHVRLMERAGGEVEPVACGMDPGSKKEGLTVKSAKRTFLNIQADAVIWVSETVETRKEMRRGRRFRKTPCRADRKNRARGTLPPSTRARWGSKLRLARWLATLYPISVFMVEDVKARTKGQRKWDVSFSPLEVGKAWFYEELAKIARVLTKSGWETKLLRDAMGLKKTGNKMAEVFEAHCVDSWALAASAVGGTVPDNTRLILMTPLRFHRRQLHRFQPEKGGARKPYGGTRSLGFKRGSLVVHPKHGVAYVGGAMGGRLSLHSMENGGRLCQNAKPEECMFLTYGSWRTRMAS